MNSRDPNARPNPSDQERPDVGRKLAPLSARISAAALVLLLMLLLVPSGARLNYVLTCFFLFMIGLLVRFIQKRKPMEFDLNEFRLRAIAWYESLERRQQLYINIVAFIPVLFYFYVISIGPMLLTLLFGFLTYCLCVAIYDIIRIYVGISKTLLGKALLAVGFAVGSNLAFSISGAIISEMAHAPAATFPHTLSFLAVGAIPFLFVLLGVVYIPIAILIGPIYYYFSKLSSKAPRLMHWLFGFTIEPKRRRYMTVTLLFQIFFYSILCLLAPKIFSYTINQHSHQIEWVISKSIYEFDMYPGTECKLEDGARYASLGDEKFVTATQGADGIKFGPPRKCAL